MHNASHPRARRATAAALTLLVASWAGTASADYVIGGSGNDNTYPFGTTSYYTGGYQQLYSASAFSGPVTISGLAFQSTKLLSPGSETLTFSLGLSTTTASMAAPSTSFAANKGADFTTVFDGPVTFTGQNNGTFDLVIPVAPFAYDPSKGNLLMDVVVTGSSGQGVASFASGPSGNVTRVYEVAGTPLSGMNSVGVGEGLLTRFTTAAVVPEPSAVVGFVTGGGLLLLGSLRASRRAR